MNLEGEISLVTGASRGIGKAIALRLGQAGATVIGTATSEGGAKSISQYLADNQIAGSGLKLDVNNDEDVAALIENINSNCST